MWLDDKAIGRIRAWGSVGLMEGLEGLLSRLPKYACDINQRTSQILPMIVFGDVSSVRAKIQPITSLRSSANLSSR